MNEQLFHILQKLVVKNNIRLHQEELKLQLLSHPSYPSLHSITGVLEHFNVNNLALRLPPTQEVVDQLPKVFIANLETDHGEDLVLVEKKNSRIRVTTDTKKSEAIDNDTFISRWNGIVVAIEKDENTEEYKSDPASKITNGILVLLSLFIVGFFIFSKQAVFPIAHFLLSIVGTFLSVLIVRHELGLQTTASNKLCNLNESTSCDAVLNSDGAKILGLFKLSDVSIVAFVGYLAAWFLFLLNGLENYSLFIAFSSLAIPFTFYSIYYQYNVVKKWCPLCIGVVCVLLLQFAAFIIGGTSVSSIFFELNNALVFTAGFILVIPGWTFLKPLLKKKTNLEKLEVEHYKFKRNFSIFQALLEQEETLKTSQPIDGEILLGNDNAPIKLTLVTSPFCIFCKEAHRDIEKLLENKDINVSLRFIVNSNDKDDAFYKIISELLHTYHTKGKAATLILLSDLYAEDVDLLTWVENRNIHYNPGYDKIMDLQKSWCSENGINFTPGLFLFEKKFPKEYGRTDLLQFSDDLKDHLSHLALGPINERIAS